VALPLVVEEVLLPLMEEDMEDLLVVATEEAAMADRGMMSDRPSTVLATVRLLAVESLTATGLHRLAAVFLRLLLLMVLLPSTALPTTHTTTATLLLAPTTLLTLLL
jgi:hypothetical protein